MEGPQSTPLPLPQGNFLALLISINDESAPTAGAGAGSAAAPASAGAPPDPPAPAPLSTLFSSSLDAAPQGMPNLSDILLAGGQGPFGRFRVMHDPDDGEVNCLPSQWRSLWGCPTTFAARHMMRIWRCA